MVVVGSYLFLNVSIIKVEVEASQHAELRKIAAGVYKTIGNSSVNLRNRKQLFPLSL
jgi:hypothetical protein